MFYYAEAFEPLVVATIRFCSYGVFNSTLVHEVSMTSDERSQNAALRRGNVQGTLHTLLFGSPGVGRRWKYLTGLALGLFGVTFLAYEFDIFYHSGGVAFIPFHAAIVGGIAAFWAGYRRNGLVAGWGLVYLSLLGMQAEWATNISPRPLLDRVASIIQPDGLVVLAVIGVVVAVVGFTAGALVRKGIETLRSKHI